VLDALYNNLARTLCELAARRFDGAVVVECPDDGSSIGLNIAQGLVCAAEIPGHLPYRSRVRQRLLSLFQAPQQLAVQISPRRANSSGYKLVPPLHPYAIVRQFLRFLPDAELDRRCAALVTATVRLRAGAEPPWWLLQPAETALTDQLLVPHTVTDLLCRWPEERVGLLRLIALLAAAGALDVTTQSPKTPIEALRLLGVDDAASPGQVRRAYLDLAKRFHPDRHPDVSQAQRQALAHRFSTIDDAYRVLQRRLDA